MLDFSGNQHILDTIKQDRNSTTSNSRIIFEDVLELSKNLFGKKYHRQDKFQEVEFSVRKDENEGDVTSIVPLTKSFQNGVLNSVGNGKLLVTKSQIHPTDNPSNNLLYENEKAIPMEPWWVRKAIDEPLDPDFEEFINTDVHYCVKNVKLSTINKNTISDSLTINNNGPMYLLICHISNLKLSSYKTKFIQRPWYELYNHVFNTVMFYGRIVSVKKYAKHNLYIVDDGTGSITVLFNHGNKQIKSNICDLNALDTDLALAEVKGLPNMLPDSKHSPVAEECIEMMKKLSVLIRQRVNKSTKEFALGDKVYVIGPPKNDNETKTWRVFAFSIELDESFGQVELFWKRFIILLYERVYLNKSRTN